MKALRKNVRVCVTKVYNFRGKVNCHASGQQQLCGLKYISIEFSDRSDPIHEWLYMSKNVYKYTNIADIIIQCVNDKGKNISNF